jgi:hypothetical protein
LIEKKKTQGAPRDNANRALARGQTSTRWGALTGRAEGVANGKNLKHVLCFYIPSFDVFAFTAKDATNADLDSTIAAVVEGARERVYHAPREGRRLVLLASGWTAAGNSA